MPEIPKDFRIVPDRIGPDPWVGAEAVIPASSDDELMVVFKGTVMPKRQMAGPFASGVKTWGQYCREAAERGQLPTPAVDAPQRYFVGYYCPRGGGHYELVGSDDYSSECGSKGWELYLDGATSGDPDLPPGEWL